MRALFCRKWEIITPLARGIIGFIGPEGVLMLPKRLQTEYESYPFHSFVVSIDEFSRARDPKGEEPHNHLTFS